MPLNSFAETIPTIFAQVWLPADGTNVKVIVPPQPTIHRLDTLLAVNDDNVAHVFTLAMVDPASTIHGIGSVSIPSLAGHSPNAQLDIFASLFPATQIGLALPAGWNLQAFLAVGATSAVGVFAIGGYF